MLGSAADNGRILYGGRVKSDNARAFRRSLNSLDPVSFAEIVNLYI